MADKVPLGMEFMRWQSVPSLTESLMSGKSPLLKIAGLLLADGEKKNEYDLAGENAIPDTGGGLSYKPGMSLQDTGAGIAPPTMSTQPTGIGLKPLPSLQQPTPNYGILDNSQFGSLTFDLNKQIQDFWKR
jgi:hypothetical protein